MAYDGVKLAEGREAEEGVDYVGRQLDRRLPLFPQDPRQRPEQSLVLRELLEVVRIPRQLQNQPRTANLRIL